MSEPVFEDITLHITVDLEAADTRAFPTAHEKGHDTVIIGEDGDDRGDRSMTDTVVEGLADALREQKARFGRGADFDVVNVETPLKSAQSSHFGDDEGRIHLEYDDSSYPGYHESLAGYLLIDAINQLPGITADVRFSLQERIGLHKTEFAHELDWMFPEVVER